MCIKRVIYACKSSHYGILAVYIIIPCDGIQCSNDVITFAFERDMYDVISVKCDNILYKVLWSITSAFQRIIIAEHFVNLLLRVQTCDVNIYFKIVENNEMQKIISHKTIWDQQR